MEPSARIVNQFGCSVTHGWSGEACSAKSSATSKPFSAATSMKCSKSAIVPRSGWIVSWPPASDPIAHGEPGSSGPGVRVLFGPLRNVCPIGWIGGR